ncbi:MAG: hypothetical protein DI527_00675 [Chelatococcus sp.]|nr:MAG: hypothetical protein DI527_00675 [Chelatococcus sp.]
MRFGVAAVAALALLSTGSGAMAEKVTAGSKGGIICTDPIEMVAMIERKLKNAPLDMGSTCQPVPAWTTIEATNAEDLTPEIKGGLGKNADGKTIAFLIWRDVAKPTSAGRSFKRVSPNDVRNTPAKWQGRDIEFTNVNVYWVASDDVRILTGTNVTLFATDIRSVEASFFSSQCETEEEALSRKCRATVRFRYSEFGEDQPNGILKRIVLTSNDVELIKPVGR